MYDLNLPSFDAKIRKNNDNFEVFDLLRKKYVALTPEEWVRQNFVNYLISEKNYPVSLMVNEANINLNNLNRRCDTVVYNNKLEPNVIIEYKKPDIVITQKVFDQIAKYNLVLKVGYLIVSNGITHYCCKMNYDDMSFKYLSEIPDYATVSSDN
ncbi:MAG: type I restriction enzyme HsdR N-terminal domain-containing protein [Dysgonamonadaceae bacterium]